MPREARHLTLAFLGDVPEADALVAADALEAACAGVPRIPLRAAGLGTFGRKDDATLWLGIARSPELERLAARLREELAARELSFDGKPFKPHVTLARRARIPRGDLPPCPSRSPTRPRRPRCSRARFAATEPCTSRFAPCASSDSVCGKRPHAVVRSWFTTRPNSARTSSASLACPRAHMVFATSASVVMSPPSRMPGCSAKARPTS